MLLHARPFIPVLGLVLTMAGCAGGATEHLWDFAVCLTPRPIEPETLVRGLRTSDGAIHLQVACNDGETRWVTLRSAKELDGDTSPWPRLYSSATVLTKKPWHLGLDGIAFSIANAGDPPSPSDRPTLVLAGGQLTLRHTPEQPQVLLTFPDPRLCAAPAVRPAVIVAAILCTPAALFADTVLCFLWLM